MPQTRTVTPFMAAMRGVDHRILNDVGLDAEGNLVDEHDPRVRPLGSRRRYDAKAPTWLSTMVMFLTTLTAPRQIVMLRRAHAK